MGEQLQHEDAFIMQHRDFLTLLFLAIQPPNLRSPSYGQKIPKFEFVSARVSWIMFVLTVFGVMTRLDSTCLLKSVLDSCSVVNLGLMLPMLAEWTLAAWESNIPWWQEVARDFQGQPWAEPSA